MKDPVEKIKSVLALNRIDAAGPWRMLIERIAVLLVVCFFATVLFLPSITFIGHSYSPGDVARRDIKSPVAVTVGDLVVKRGESIVRDGQVLTERDIEKLDLVVKALDESRTFLPATGFFVFIALFIFVVYYFASRNIRRFSTQPKDLVLLAVVFLGVVSLISFSGFSSAVMAEVFPFIPSSVYKFTVPIAVGAMLVRLILNSETAIIFAAVVAVTAGFYLGGDVDMAAYSFVGGVAAAVGVRQCTHRTIVLRAGVKLGIVNAITLIALTAIRGAGTVSEPFFIVFAGLANGMITAVLAIGITPILESTFRYTTNIKLLELARMDHPLLKELAMRAPGTYHHSIVIGTLVEAAAESINANPLLARVAAYYHDIGKSKMPEYFIENSSGENRHDKLTPSMSALIISSHVKEGTVLAKKNHLGREITDVIRQHHGTSLITFFYQKASNQEDGDTGEVDEKDFRYPGPKPQTKEAGLVMLADAIEAASKTLKDPTPDRIQWLTQKIVNKIFADGQLDECELTLKDLHAISLSFNRALAGIYHQRIDYPEPTDILKEAKVESTHNRGGVKAQGKDTGEAGEKEGGRATGGEGASGEGDKEGGPQGGEDKDKEDGRDRLKRLGIQ